MPASHRGLLLSLPNELLHEIALGLNPKAVNAFMRANHRLYHLLAPLLNRLLSQHADRVLSWAVKNKKEYFFQLAIEKGADGQSLVLGSNKPPLYFAVVSGWDNSVKLLVDKGARSFGYFNVSYDHTVLHSAVLCKHLSTTRLLLDLGWSVSVPTNITQPLNKAIFASTEQIVELLIERGANVNAMVNDESMLDVAVHRPGGGLPIIKMLLRNGFDTGARDSNDLSVLGNAFREAVKIGDESVAKFLLEEGADIKCRSPVRYETALHTAIRLEQWPMLKMLLDNGININTRNREKETALFGAAIGRTRDDPSRKYFVCYYEDGMSDRVRPALLGGFKLKDRLPVIELLLEAGIDVNARDRGNDTVLFRAVCRDSMPIIQLLLQHGADIHARNGDNDCTALHAAAGCGDVSIVQLLLENGSDINSQTKDGSTALHLALQHGDIETAKLLTENGIDIAPRAKILHHFDRNPYISDGASALYLAIRWGHEDFARKLLAKGARVDVQYNLKVCEDFKANEALRRRIVTMFDEKQLKPIILCGGEDGDAQADKETVIPVSGKNFNPSTEQLW